MRFAYVICGGCKMVCEQAAGRQGGPQQLVGCFIISNIITHAHASCVFVGACSLSPQLHDTRTHVPTYLLVPNDIGKVHRIAIAVEVNLVQHRVGFADLLLAGAPTWFLPRCNRGEEGRAIGRRFRRCDTLGTGVRHPHKKSNSDDLQKLDPKTKSHCILLPTPG